jgi:hypothetical protein
MYLSESEGAKFWLSVLTDLKSRGVEDILIACIDGLKGFPELRSKPVWPPDPKQPTLYCRERQEGFYGGFKAGLSSLQPGRRL